MTQEYNNDAWLRDRKLELCRIVNCHGRQRARMSTGMERAHTETESACLFDRHGTRKAMENGDCILYGNNFA